MTQPLVVANNLDQQQQAAFYAYMAAYQKDEVVGVLLAFFLGSFGAHHFYLRRTGLGILYALFCWTGIPTVVSLIECFFMPGRVRLYNAEQALMIASMISAASSISARSRALRCCTLPSCTIISTASAPAPGCGIWSFLSPASP